MRTRKVQVDLRRAAAFGTKVGSEFPVSCWNRSYRLHVVAVSRGAVGTRRTALCGSGGASLLVGIMADEMAFPIEGLWDSLQL